MTDAEDFAKGAQWALTQVAQFIADLERGIDRAGPVEFVRLVENA